MRKVLPITILFFLFAVSISRSQSQSISSNTQQIVNTLEEKEDQQINKDEGYGSNDQEYYNSEGINAESNRQSAED